MKKSIVKSAPRIPDLPELKQPFLPIDSLNRYGKF